MRVRRALDFGCGTGRSTRLLRSYAFEATGIDIAEPMIRRARELVPGGDYRVCSPQELRPSGGFDLILAAFPFDNVSAHRKSALFSALRALMKPSGRFINIVSSPDIYVREWASFSTQSFPENKDAKNGEIVRIVTRGFKTRKPAEDILCTAESYRTICGESGLKIVAEEHPLGRQEDGIKWLSEAEVAPWTIYVLERDLPVGAAPARS